MKLNFPLALHLPNFDSASQSIPTKNIKLLYIGSQWSKRVPSTRRIFLEGAPKALASLRDKTEELSFKLGTTLQVTRKALDHLEEAQFSKPLSMTSEIAQYQWTTQEIIDVLLGMDWTVLIARGLDRFLTGDNPGFFAWKEGLSVPGSQLAFPLSSGAALHMDRRKSKVSSSDRKDATSAQVKEINRPHDTWF